jgi:hypothetical protein
MHAAHACAPLTAHTPPPPPHTHTGYEGIDNLREQVARADAALSSARKQLQAAKAAYEAQLDTQSQLHRWARVAVRCRALLCVCVCVCVP